MQKFPEFKGELKWMNLCLMRKKRIIIKKARTY